MKATAIKITTGNNEELTRCIVAENDGTYTAIGLSASKNFKTLRGANAWMSKRVSK